MAELTQEDVQAILKIIDTTLRDAHQCLWATRMTTAMMLPVADRMDRAGFETIDLMSAIQFDVCVRYLKAVSSEQDISHECGPE